MTQHKLILLCLVFLIIGGFMGYVMGVSWALNWGVEKAIMMLDKQGIEIKFNPKMISAGLYQYQNNIGGLINCDNAQIYNDTGS